MTNRPDTITWLPLKVWTRDVTRARTIERVMGEVGMASIGLHHREEFVQELGNYSPLWFAVGLYPSTSTADEMKQQIAEKVGVAVAELWPEVDKK